MIVITKIRASALQFALLVGTLVAILLGSFLMLSRIQTLFALQSDRLLETITVSDHAIHQINEFGFAKRLQNGSLSEGIELETSTSYWGSFQLSHTTASYRNKPFSKISLNAGGDVQEELAVYVENTHLPLVVAGGAQIWGNAALPEKGIKAGVISGNYFQGNSLVTGIRWTSKSTLPELDANWLTYLKELELFIPSAEDHLLDRSNDNKNSFYDPTQHLYSESELLLTENYLGNILIKSATEITVTPFARLTDVILVAPKITFQRGFTGSATAIAKKQVIVESGSTLRYPSAVIVSNFEPGEASVSSSEEIPLMLEEHAHIEGVVLFLSDHPDMGDASQRAAIHLSTAPNTVIEGMVYCQGNTDHRGLIRGSIYTKRFVAKEAGSRYINHLYDGKIRAIERHPDFSGMLFSNEKKQVVKWLY
ncbi:MAG: hypothetical protein AAF466_02380 [Bacteroidota bacterium]